MRKFYAVSQSSVTFRRKNHKIQFYNNNKNYKYSLKFIVALGKHVRQCANSFRSFTQYFAFLLQFRYFCKNPNLCLNAQKYVLYQLIYSDSKTFGKSLHDFSVIVTKIYFSRKSFVQTLLTVRHNYSNKHRRRQSYRNTSQNKKEKGGKSQQNP